MEPVRYGAGVNQTSVQMIAYTGILDRRNNMFRDGNTKKNQQWSGKLSHACWLVSGRKRWAQMWRMHGLDVVIVFSWKVAIRVVICLRASLNQSRSQAS